MFYFHPNETPKLGFIWMGSFLPNSSQLGWMIILSILAFLFLGGVLGGFSNQVTILDEEFLLKITYV
jgi:hypothetical protein